MQRAHKVARISLDLFDGGMECKIVDILATEGGRELLADCLGTIANKELRVRFGEKLPVGSCYFYREHLLNDKSTLDILSMWVKKDPTCATLENLCAGLKKAGLRAALSKLEKHDATLREYAAAGAKLAAPADNE